MPDRPCLWPGEVEVSEGLAADLHDLAVRGAMGLLRWDGQRWQVLDPIQVGGDGTA